MTDFIFLASPQDIAAIGLAILAALAFALSCYVLVGWVSDMIEAYGDDLDHWHITEARDDSDRH